jgi:glycosyltransferase involved in cell wall biosynthesis
MRIGFFITTMNSGGAERVMSLIANYHASKGHDVFLFIYYKVPSFYKLNSSIKTFYLTPDRPKLGKFGIVYQYFINYFKVKRILKTEKIDCLVSFTTVINCFSTVLAKDLGIPLVISERNEPLIYKPSAGLNFLRKLIYRYADAIVLQTERSRMSFDKLKIKLPSIKAVIFNPVDPSFKNYNLERDNTIVSVGRLTKEKGHDLLLRAFALVKSKNWKLLMIGDGLEKDNLIRLSESLNISEQISWLGKKKNICDFLNKSSIFILPSRTEGFPNALCEAMACGCAVISFDCQNGPSEIIRNGENGILVPDGDINSMSVSLDALIQNEAMRFELSAKATTMKTELAVDRICEKWESLIDKVVNFSKK